MNDVEMQDDSDDWMTVVDSGGLKYHQHDLHAIVSVKRVLRNIYKQINHSVT